MQNVIELLKQKGLWNDKLVYFTPKRIQVQHEQSRDIVGVELTDIPIREYLDKIEFDYSNKPLFKSIVDAFDRYKWGLRIIETNGNDNDWHFLIDFETVIDSVIQTEPVWDPNTGALISQLQYNPTSATKLLNKFFPLNSIYTAETRSKFLAEQGRRPADWDDAVTNVSFDYDYANDSINEVFRCYGLFFFDAMKAQEWRETATGAHSQEFNPIQGEAYQHIYKTVNGQYSKRLNNEISVNKADFFEDTIQLNEILNPLHVSYSSFKRDDGLSGIDLFSY